MAVKSCLTLVATTLFLTLIHQADINITYSSEENGFDRI